MNFGLIKDFILSFNSNDLLFFTLILTIIGIYSLISSNKKNVEYSKSDINLKNLDIKYPSEYGLPHYPNGWLPVIESRDLHKSEVKPIFAFGNDLIAFRGQSGKVYVFDAYCPHLGTNLGVGGDVIEESIKCPFHGWIFNNEGKCTFAPQLETTNLPKVMLKKWENIEENGFVFVWNNSKRETPNWFPQSVKEISENKFYFTGKLEFPVNGHIQEISENANYWLYLDESESRLQLGNLFNNRPFYKILLGYINGCINAKWNPCSPPDQYIAESEIEINYSLFDFFNFKAKLLTKQMGPQLFHQQLEINFLFKWKIHIIKAIITTTNPLIHRVVQQIYTESTLKGYLIKIILVVNKWLKIGLNSQNSNTFYGKPISAKNKLSVNRFRFWFNQFYSEDTTNVQSSQLQPNDDK